MAAWLRPTTWTWVSDAVGTQTLSDWECPVHKRIHAAKQASSKEVQRSTHFTAHDVTYNVCHRGKQPEVLNSETDTFSVFKKRSGSGDFDLEALATDGHVLGSLWQPAMTLILGVILLLFVLFGK
jgi:hypothetical protein